MSTNSHPTVRDASLQFLREVGIDTIFGNPGSTELPLFRDFPEDLRYILGLQESTVVAMADGYSQATKSATVVNLHSAAGLGHAMGNLFTAFKNQSPLIVTAGQQARSILPYDPFLFAAQATELPKPYVKWACEPARARGRAAGARSRLLCGDAAATRAGLRVDSGGRLGSTFRLGAASPGQCESGSGSRPSGALEGRHLRCEETCDRRRCGG